MYSLGEYSREYFQLMESVNKRGHVLNISTITYLCTLNVDEINLKLFCERFDTISHERYGDIVIKTPIRDDTCNKRGKNKRSFFNQLTLNFRDINKKSIKIFSNGKLQITGLTSMFECKYVSEYIVSLLMYVLRGDIRPDATINRGYIGMLNANFSLNNNIDLTKLNKILQKRDKCFCVYNPESYPAINLKIQTDDRWLSVFVFGTGNIVITGSKCISEMDFAYCFITHALSIDNVSKSTEFKPKAIRNEPYIYGYNIRQFLSCIS